MAFDVTLERANATITLDAAGEATNAETVIIAGKTYTFLATLTDSDGNVHIGSNVAGTVDNLVAAINLSNEGESAVSAGTDYAASMTKNTRVFATRVAATGVITLYAKVPGDVGNLIPLDAGTSTITIGNAVLENGVGDVGSFFDGLFELNQINAELTAALRQFSPVEGGFLDGVTGSA